MILPVMESLDRDEIHVWYLWPDQITDDSVRRHARILSNDENARAESFRFEEDRKSYLLGKAFARTLLSRYASIDPTAWEFTPNQYGKPSISGPSGAPDIRFNISHTRGLLAAVFALNSSVGIDVENHHQRVDTLSIAETYLSPAEYSALCELPDPDRHRRFLEYWTLKEAYAKAHGTGMSMDLSGFSFDIQTDAARIKYHSDDPADPSLWMFRLLRPSPHHTVAVALSRSSQSAFRLDIRDGTSLMH